MHRLCWRLSERIVLSLWEPVQARQAINHIWQTAKAKLMAGNRLVLELRPEKRRDNHNRHFHSLIAQIAQHVGGDLAESEDAKRILISAFRIDTRSDPDLADDWAKFGDMRIVRGLRGESVLMGMARVSKCDKLQEHDRLRLVGRIGEGVSWRDLEADFSIPAATIRQWAERNGHARSPTASKRKMVEELLARPETAQDGDQTARQTAHCAVSTGNPDYDAAAQEDARDMRLGLQAARLALKVSAMGLKGMAESGEPDAKLTKVWSECVAINVATIRKIRGLDDQTQTAAITIANPRSFV